MSDRHVFDRRAGVLIPLSALRSRDGFGVGEIPDLAATAVWLEEAGHGLLQLLPIGEPSPGQDSPYAARTAFAIDPLYIAMRELEDFQAAGGEAALPAGDRAALARAREAAAVDYGAVRPLKWRALDLAYRRFADTEWRTGSGRAEAFRTFTREQAGWLDDYALFRAIQEADPGRPWWEWEAGLARHDARALAERRDALADRVRFFQYVQWLADRQWGEARREAAARGVLIKGDLPFMVATDSADVWARQGEFRMDATVGAPPDAFSAEGQDWGLPVYDFSAMGANGYEWLQERAYRSAELYDLYRIDHVVGFYRIFVRPKGGALADAHFVPEDEGDQLQLGETLLKVLGGAGRVVAEDLGVIPDFVRASMARLGIPGYKILRWEREWKEEEQPFRDPAGYDALSVATSGTHDTETMAQWWKDMPDDERRALVEIPALAALRESPPREFTPAVRDTLLDALYGAGSDLVIPPVQDVFGLEDRINVPGTVGPQNWSWRMPWSADDLRRDPALAARTGELAQLTARHGRRPAAGRGAA
jgi:4-alpha-glucanotransferase